MASKKKTCDMCGKHCLRDEMVPYKDKLMCDQDCVELYIESYETEEVKSID